MFEQFIKRLLSRWYERHARERDLAFIRAVELGNWKRALYLLKRGVDVNAQTAVGFTALHLAAANGDIGLVGVLLRHGADVDAQSVGGTPLHLAAQNGHVRVVNALLLYEASPLLTDPDGATPEKDAATEEIAALLRSAARRRLMGR